MLKHIFGAIKLMINANHGSEVIHRNLSVLDKPHKHDWVFKQTGEIVYGAEAEGFFVCCVCGRIETPGME